MTREEHLKFCKVCKNKKFDIHKGIVCGLTNEIADFEESCPSFSKIEKVSYLENKKKNTKAKQQERKRKAKEDRKEKNEKISRNDLRLIVLGSLIAVFINRLLVYAEYPSTNFLLRLSFYLPFLILFVAILLLRKKKRKQYRFFGDIKFRFLYSLLTAILILSYTLMIGRYQANLVAVFFGFTIIIFVLSFLGFFIIKPIVLLYRKEISLNISYKRSFLISISLILLLLLLEKDFLIKREIFYWQTDNSLTWVNFRGYPNYLSMYDAAIKSEFNYKITGDSVIIEAYAEPHHSWVKRNTRDSKYCLKHENYHFNISEIIARKFRKEVSELSQKSVNEKTIKSIYEKYYNKLLFTQAKYDEDTDHSRQIERQKDWEYLIDSLLREYEVYRNALISFDHKKRNYKFYRQIVIDPQFNIVGKFPIDSLVASKINHYRVYYKNGKAFRIKFKRKNRLARDEFFGVSVVNIISKGNNIIWQFLDTNLQKTVSNDGVFQVKIVKDYDNKQIVKTNFNVKQAIAPGKLGVSKVIWKLDHKKRIEVGSFYDQNDNRIIDNKGHYLLKLRYDSNNNVIEQSNFNKENKLIEANDGVAVLKYEHDTKGNVTRVRSFDSKMKSTPFNGLIADASYDYDQAGHIISESYKQADGTPYFDDNRVVVSHYKYDDYSNVLEESHYGANKNLKINEDGLGRIKRKYDSVGNTIEAVNYDAYDKFLNDNNGHCKMEFSYDSLNRTITQTEYSVDSLNQIHHLRTIKFEYDQNSNVICERYFNEKDSLISDSAKASIVKFEYDKRGNLTKVENYDSDTNLIPVNEGIAIFRYEYDDKNNKTLAAYYNENDILTNGVDGIAYDKYYYNERNQLIERRYYDCNNRLTKNSNGVEIVKWVKDVNGNVTKEVYYDKNDEITEDEDGIALLKLYYDQNQNNTKIEYYNDKLELLKDVNDDIAIVKYTYDQRNNLIETSYYDCDKRIHETDEGYAIEKQLFDRYDRLIRREFFDQFKHPVVSSYGFASVNWEYDKNDNVVTEVYRDENDELIEDEDGYAIYNWIYNRNGDVVESYAYNADKINLANLNYGHFNSSVKSINYFSGLSNYSSGNTRIQTTYYDNGQKESEAHYVNGKLNGIYRTWYITGELKSEIMYIDGMRIGKMTEYYKNGQVKRIMSYENNIMVNNSQVTYYENGKIHTMFLDGKFVEYDIEGNVIDEEVLVYN